MSAGVGPLLVSLVVPLVVYRRRVWRVGEIGETGRSLGRIGGCIQRHVLYSVHGAVWAVCIAGDAGEAVECSRAASVMRAFWCGDVRVVVDSSRLAAIRNALDVVVDVIVGAYEARGQR